MKKELLIALVGIFAYMCAVPLSADAYYKAGSNIGPGGTHPSMWTKEAASAPTTGYTPHTPVNGTGVVGMPVPPNVYRRSIYAGSRMRKRPPYYRQCKKMLGYWDPYYCAMHFGVNANQNTTGKTEVNVNNYYYNTNNSDSNSENINYNDNSNSDNKSKK